MPTVAILGCAGYTGQETLDRVLNHPELEPVALGSDSQAGRPAVVLDPRLARNGALPDLV
jgi:N-acetyl-gamma-glutamylphosphate reductase